MKLSLAANYDLEVIPELKDTPVVEVFGKLPSDFAGGGRPSYMAGKLNFKKLADYVSELRKNDIHFNYLLNGSCLGNREFTRAWQKKFTAFMEKLIHTGITRVTVSTPFLLEMIKSRFPHFHVKAGIYAQIDTPTRAIFWQDLGADELTLESFSINRDFPRLKAIRKAVTCNLQLIVNHPCLANCSMQPYHQNGFAHSSAPGQNIFIDYCFLKCSRKRLEQPANLIKAGWIRPEDIHYYEKIGYNNFKIIERNMPSEDMITRVKAYHKRTSPPNLAKIILPYGFKNRIKKDKFWKLKYFFKPAQVNPFKLRPLIQLAKIQGMLYPSDREPIFIDSKKIPSDFLNAMPPHCKAGFCYNCDYCLKISNRAVHIDPEFKEDVLARYDRIDRFLNSGELWNV